MELIEKLKDLKSFLLGITPPKNTFKLIEELDEAIALLEKPRVSAEEVETEIEKEARAYEYCHQQRHSNYHAFKSGYKQATLYYAGHSDAKTRLEKFRVCTDCYNVNISDPNCICCHSNEYETIELEFEVCNCCNNIIQDGSPADTSFNKEQLDS